MSLERVRNSWDQFGKDDAFWAILTDPSRRGGLWSADDLFATGRAQIGQILGDLESLGLTIGRGRCLDFGCGVGRLTQALADHFAHCDGVDIAPSMITLAHQYNRHGERCTYHLNDRADLRIFQDDSFDAVVSLIVLQHMEPRFSRLYIAEFVRVLKPSGIAVFQLPGAHHPEQLAHQPLLSLAVGAHRATLQAGLTSLSTEPGRRTRVHVRVTNAGTAAWAAGSPVNVGNHWLTARGTLLVLDDGRKHIPELAPGESAELALLVTPPRRRGRYLLELDVVEEGVAWFADRGSPTLRLPVANGLPRWRWRRPRTQSGVPDDDEPALEPVMEMHSVPVDEVVAVVSRAGARVVEVREWDMTGPGWDSYRYIVIKEASP